MGSSSGLGLWFWVEVGLGFAPDATLPEKKERKRKRSGGRKAETKDKRRTCPRCRSAQTRAGSSTWLWRRVLQPTP